MTTEPLVRFSCVLGLAALSLMVWSVLDRTVWPVLVALSVGQGIGTLSLLLFLVAIAKDLDLRRHLRR
jgi:hypothetical protein